MIAVLLHKLEVSRGVGPPQRRCSWSSSIHRVGHTLDIVCGLPLDVNGTNSFLDGATEIPPPC